MRPSCLKQDGTIYATSIVFIEVPRAERLGRLHAGRGWDEAEVERREASQVSLETKRNRSQFVIDNARSIDEAGRELEQRLSQINAQNTFRSNPLMISAIRLLC